MASFSSSVVNKSGKKFAPKVPIRRASAATAAARKPTVDQPAQSQSIPPHAAPRTTTAPLPTPPSTAPEPSQIAEPSLTPAHIEPPSPEPLPKAKPSLSNKHAIPIPIPAPRRRLSNSTSKPVLIKPAAKPTVTNATSRTPAVITPQPSQAQRNDTGANKRPHDSLDPLVEQVPTTMPAVSTSMQTSPEVSADVRPAKRVRVAEPVSRTQASEASSATATSGTESTQRPAATKKSVATRKTHSAAKTTNSRARRKRSTEATGEAGSDTAQRKSRGSRKRETTPENAEEIEIVSAVVKMSDLCKDLRIGRKSKREMELRSMDWDEIARKKKEREAREMEESRTEKRNGSIDRPIKHNGVATGGPQMRIVNGEIVLDTSSLQIDRHADAARNMEEMEEVEENPLTRKINSASFGKRTKPEVWDEELTNLFYKGLRMFGTDFMMISRLFPGRTRRHIKLKFSNEERKDPERIKATLLGPREPVTLEAYSEMTNTVYDDPRAIEQELEEEKKRIEEQHAREKEAREEMLRNPSGDSNVLPSVESGNAKRRRNEKKRVNTFVGGGGTEEILGTIDD
ncbi:hypothetical protein VTO42DRAFT_2153 [Malbranchea cinnamomea]